MTGEYKYLKVSFTERKRKKEKDEGWICNKYDLQAQSDL